MAPEPPICVRKRTNRGSKGGLKKLGKSEGGERENEGEDTEAGKKKRREKERKRIKSKMEKLNTDLRV